MRDTDREEFANRLWAVADFYGQSEKLSDTIIELWWRLMERYTIAQFGNALTKHMLDTKHGRFMPRPADIKLQIDGSQDDITAQAWMSAREAVRRVGHWQSVAFDDPGIAEAIEAIGGWQRLCSLDQEQMVWAEKEFREKYRSGSKHSGVLWGATALQNKANGLMQHVEAPIPIGHDMKAAVAHAKQASLTQQTPAAILAVVDHLRNVE